MAETIKQKSCISSYRDDMIRYCIGITRRRALPEAKDSLKPVQRRNVYSMFELNAYGNGIRSVLLLHHYSVTHSSPLNPVPLSFWLPFSLQL